MTIKKVKDAAKIFSSDKTFLENTVVKTMQRINNIVGSSMGPGGKPSILESEFPNIPNKITKDGVTIFKNLGASDPYEQLIIETARDAATRTNTEAGDGPLPTYAKVLTPNGWSTMGNMVVGMEICGTNGTKQIVTGVYHKGQKEICKVTLSDKRVVECCSDHLWAVTTEQGNKSVKTTSSLMEDFVKIDKSGYNNYKYFLPITYTEFNETSELPLDPYLVGVLLGDGSLSDSGSIELSLGLNKEHIINKIKLPIGVTKTVQLVEKRNSYRVKLQGIRPIIELLGLSNSKSKTKFIPKSYLYSSIQTRQALLQGLIDTDGYVNNRGLFEFSTVSDELANDFISLSRSLGKSIHHRIHTREKDSGSYSNTPIHKIQELKGYKYGAKIVNIEKTGKFTEMMCIKVSNPDNLYITDNFVVTHNTTTATVLAAVLIQEMIKYCRMNPKISPQKIARTVQSYVLKELIPIIRNKSIKITNKNKALLEQVATISANGDKEMSSAVIKAFEIIGYGESSHVTIQELSGPEKYDVEVVDGFPISKGYEESIGKFHSSFINDQANLRCVLENPLFLLFDGAITDLMQIMHIVNDLGERYNTGHSEYKNLVIVANGFSESVLNDLTFNFPLPTTLNVVPLLTPLDQIINSQTNFLMDLAAFTGAKVFGINRPLKSIEGDQDLGLINQVDEDGNKLGVQLIEIYRFRTTIVGNPDPLLVESRVDDLKNQEKQAQSTIEKRFLTERIGKLTSGIAKLKIFGGSTGELKEKHDRCEDAICSVRSAIANGCLPGGCRTFLDLCMHIVKTTEDPIINGVLVTSLMEPIHKLLDNSGYTADEQEEIIAKLLEKPELVYDVENAKFGKAKDLGLYDSELAVEQSLRNAISIASVLGTLGGIVAFPRDNQLEREEAHKDLEYMKTVDDPTRHKNEADLRP